MSESWIELKRSPETDGCEKACIRPEYIMEIGLVKPGITSVSYEVGRDYETIFVEEPYEQVKQKIMGAEITTVQLVSKDNFTKDELIMLCAWADSDWLYEKVENRENYRNLRHKLNNLLEKL